MKNINCFIGLGNKGNEYNNTRHNFGKDFLLWVAKKEKLSWKDNNLYLHTVLKINDKEINLFIPNSYMNESGIIINKIKNYFDDAENLLIINDDMQVNFGKFSFRANKDRGERGHNGIRSINDYLKKNNIKIPYYLSLGIGKPEDKDLIKHFVTDKFNINEKSQIEHIFNKIYIEMNNIF